VELKHATRLCSCDLTCRLAPIGLTQGVACQLRKTFALSASVVMKMAVSLQSHKSLLLISTAGNDQRLDTKHG